MSIKRLLGTIFAGIGGLFFVIALVLVSLELQFERTARRSPGEVVALRRSNKGGQAPDVAFTAFDGRQIVHRSNVYSTPAYAIGEQVTILYDPSNPEEATIDTFTGRWLMALIFGIIGVVDLSVGSTFLWLRARRKREIAWLLRHGQRVMAKVVATEEDRKVRVNRKHPWIIRCEATLPGAPGPRRFTSRRFWYDPEEVVRGRELPVYYDPQDPDRSVVDTGELPTRR